MACEHHKLVRDKIPEIIEEDGKKPVVYIADDDEYTERLVDKLEEEVEEFLESREVDELGDILEVIHAIREDREVTHEQLQKKREQKAEQRGRFDEGVVLEQVKK
jgi:predicted house-cleaning noncanonical NTP pyrophosphatase (MazG superfamily)